MFLDIFVKKMLPSKTLAKKVAVRTTYDGSETPYV